MASKVPFPYAPVTLEQSAEDNNETSRSAATRVSVTGRLVADRRECASPFAVRRGVLFQDVVAWNRLTEVTAESLVKGRRVRVEGRLRGRMWAGLWDVEVIASAVEFLPPRAA